MLKVIVAGTRTFNDYALLKEKLDVILCTKTDIEIVSGMAKGADTLGEQYAEEKGYKIKQFPADWKTGAKAGPLRNMAICDYADVCVVFWDGKSRGSKHMADIAAEKGLLLKVINYADKKSPATHKVYDKKDIPKEATILFERIERNGIVDLSVPTYDIPKLNEKKVYFYKK